MQPIYLIHEHLSYTPGRVRVSKSYEVAVFLQLLYNHQYDFLTIRFGQTVDEVHWNIFEYRFWYGQQLEQPGWSGSLIFTLLVRLTITQNACTYLLSPFQYNSADILCIVAVVPEWPPINELWKIGRILPLNSSSRPTISLPFFLAIHPPKSNVLALLSVSIATPTCCSPGQCSSWPKSSPTSQLTHWKQQVPTTPWVDNIFHAYTFRSPNAQF